MHPPPAHVLAVTAAVSALAACAPELNWRDWQSDEVSVRQAFPCKPVRQQRQVQIASRRLTLVMQVCDAAGVSWALSHATVDEPGAVNAVLEAMGQSAAANLGASAQGPQAQRVAGSTPQPAAGVLRISGRTPDGKPMDMATSLFSRGTVVFQATALGPVLPRDAVDTFLQSSRVGP